LFQLFLLLPFFNNSNFISQRFELFSQNNFCVKKFKKRMKNQKREEKEKKEKRKKVLLL